MFGSNFLVAPLFEEARERNVYLPPGAWIDYQTSKVYHGGQWQQITAGQIPVVLLVKDHSVIPHVRVAQSTSAIDWNNVELRVFSTDNAPVTGLFTLPQGNLQPLTLENAQGAYAVRNDPLRGKVKWQVKRFETQ